MNSEKRIVVNYASIGRDNYLAGSQRLINSAISVGLNADILVRSPNFTHNFEKELGRNSYLFTKTGQPVSKEFGECPPHKDAPYAFKSYIIQEALDMGYTKIMWADSSCVFFRNPEHYWNLAEDIGVVLMDNQGCPEATWTADDCLEHMGCDPEFAKTFDEIDAFMMIFNFDHPKTGKLFNKYFEHSRDGICLKGVSGSKRPEFAGHRHDQSIISYFAKIQHINTINYGAWCYFFEIVNGSYKPTFAKVGIQQGDLNQLRAVVARFYKN